MTTPSIRAFVSIDIDDLKIRSQITSAISSLQNIGGDLKPVAPENIHVTLKFLGYVPGTQIRTIEAAMDTLKFPTFTITLDGFGAFPTLKRMNVIWVGISEGWSELEKIYEQTEKIFYELGFPKETRAFSPHITIARVRSGRRTQEMAELLGKLKNNMLGNVQASKIRLKQSILSSQGPKYSTLHEVAAQQ